MSLFTQASDRTKKSDLFRWVKCGLAIRIVTLKKVNVLLGVAAMLLVVSGLVSTGGSQSQVQGNFGRGIPSVFLRKCLTFRAPQLKSATPDMMRIRLGAVKGLSRSFTGMVGELAVKSCKDYFKLIMINSSVDLSRLKTT
jgi:hypothetical protein